MTYPILQPDLQVGFYYKLKSIKDLYFHEALSKTVSQVQVADIDRELQMFVAPESLQKVATFSLRGEAIFPVPILLTKNPFLLGYYRLLLGFSQKEFYTKGPFGKFRKMEEKGVLTKSTQDNLSSLCESLVASSELLLKQIDALSIISLSELQLLTVGPQFRGSMNNQYGLIATQKTFGLIKELVKDYIVSSSLTSIQIKNDSGRLVKISFASDPDIEIVEELSSRSRGLISIEIKGGRDFSNIHNRIGEAEKSHQKAKARGYFEFMTIISVDIDYSTLKSESPTTSHFFHLDRISDKQEAEYLKFKDILASVLSVNI